MAKELTNFAREVIILFKESQLTWVLTKGVKWNFQSHQSFAVFNGCLTSFLDLPIFHFTENLVLYNLIPYFLVNNTTNFKRQLKAKKLGYMIHKYRLFLLSLKTSYLKQQMNSGRTKDGKAQWRQVLITIVLQRYLIYQQYLFFKYHHNRTSFVLDKCTFFLFS